MHFFQIPQLLENYQNRSASAISLPFLLIWFLGDICNLLGAAWAGLVPTVIAIAVYFCVADGVLIAQCGYYEYYVRQGGGQGEYAGKSAPEDATMADALGEEEPLLARQRSGSITIPGSQRRASRRRRTSSSSSAPTTTIDARRRSSQATDYYLLSQILEEDEAQDTKMWIRNSLSLLGIVVVGTAGWAIAWGSGAWMPTPVASGAGGGGGDTGPWGAQILGYASAVAYLGARIPQIVKNARERSCEGMHIPIPLRHEILLPWSSRPPS